MIPVAEIPEGKFWAALMPLYELLNTTPMHVYDSEDGGITITRDPDSMRVHVRFKHVVEDRDAETPWPITTTGDGPHDELAYDVNVEVVPTPGTPDPVAALWPGAFCKGVPAHESGV